ncbi:RyR domain-containing protein [uncultured Methanobrevibacter sp.]|uniref:RyR domain-containing protein n=1 Tax=uncultured Methanobrevibacter sp. TaxID=253161 RepID=UPI00262A03F5|nr:RyR domain-containing protein [uncultured Methanobrevibacter sp.]
MAEKTIEENNEILEKSNLKQYLDKFFDNIQLYDDLKEFDDADGNPTHHNYKKILKSSIDVFIDNESTYTAYQVYETFLMIYQITPEDKSEIDESSPDALISEPNTLLDLVDIMRTYEENTGDLINRQRDHFIHSVNVFILGLAIYAQNKRYREIFKEYILKNKHYTKYYRINGEMSHEEFLYRWGIAALFHDIGYPFEIIGKQIDKFIEDGVKSISVNYDVDAHIDFRDFNEFNAIVKLPPYNYADEYRGRYKRTKVLDLFKPTEIMAHKIAMDFKMEPLEFRKLIKHLNGFVKHMNDKGFIDHGYFSAILVLNSYGKLIQKYAKKNKDFFFYPIVDSATAILLHNYYNKTLQETFDFGKMNPRSSPISYLLIFCDELQEWNRRPYGVIDKQNNRVNDMDVYIDDQRMKVTYILKNGAMGLGFEKKKDNFIASVLDVEKIFPEKLSIIPDIRLDSVKRDVHFSQISAPDVLLRNIEKLAIELNHIYNEEKLKEAIENNDEEEIELYQSKCANKKDDFYKLPSDFIMSNIRQAKSIPVKLTMIGCEIAHDGVVDDDDKLIEIDHINEKDVEDLAIFEHESWREEREGSGWIFGDDKDVDRRISPGLTEWENLSPEVQELDKESIRIIPQLLKSIGLKVVRSRLKALTYKMNQLYETGNIDPDSDGESVFKDLPKQVQFSNYIQAEHLVKILKEKGFELVPLSDQRDAITQFDSDDIDYFAEREHEAWYQLKLNLNETDSDNFVQWDNLNPKTKNKNKLTFSKLPELCADKFVGLKIVRSE